MSKLDDHYNRSYYESIGFRHQPNSPRNQKRLEVVLAHKQEGRLLEIGCGTGEFLKLAQKHFDVEGIDVSSYAVESSRRIFGTRVQQRNVETQPIGVRKYDVIVVFNVLEHLWRPKKAIAAIHRGLNPGGIVVGSVPHNAGLIGRFHTLLTNIFDRSHQSTYHPRRWRSLFRLQRFRNIRFFGEILLGRNRNWYLHQERWRLAAFNLMFVCEK